MTISEKRSEMIRRFGNKFYNEVGLRVPEVQEAQGRKKGELNTNTMEVANQVTEQLWKEWVENCEHIPDDSQFCYRCKGYVVATQ